MFQTCRAVAIKPRLMIVGMNLIDPHKKFPERRPTVCPACKSTHITFTQRKGSAIVWLVCDGCRHVTCAPFFASPD